MNSPELQQLDAEEASENSDHVAETNHVPPTIHNDPCYTPAMREEILRALKRDIDGFD